MDKVALLGASGFLGMAMFERLQEQGRQVVPFIHSSGNAWRLARLGIPLQRVDIMSRQSLETALTGCTHVINCSRGGNSVMVDGLKNLISAAGRARVRRLVHISSVAVYGDPPPPSSTNEDAPTKPTPNSYGWVKLQQDNLIREAAAKGLPAIVLCPPNISGPFSVYLSRVVQTLNKGGLALLEGGKTHCSLVDVNNLACAAELALANGTPDGRRLFVTDDEPTTWADLVRELAPLVHTTGDLPSISRERLVALQGRQRAPQASFVKGIKHLMSENVRTALRQDPFWKEVDSMLRSLPALLGTRFEERMRRRIQGPVQVRRGGKEPIDVALSLQQLRGVAHSCERAKNELGYRPRYRFAASMSAFRRWYTQHHGLDGGYKDLIIELH
jgi:nucleoside-diphosphate-sugar epimerase